MSFPHQEYDFDFVAPPETAVFTPTMEEFKDALAYMEKIRPIAEQYGVCKIRPPEEWQPPFAVDVDKLRFTPRIQRLNELEAHTRIKLNFLDKVAKFWELQGSSLKIPIVEKKALDLLTLKKYVNMYVRHDSTKEDQQKCWAKVAAEMGYNPLQSVRIGGVLKSHYERILLPLEIFNQEEMKAKEESVKEADCKEGSGLQSRVSGPKAGSGNMRMGGNMRMKEKSRGMKLNFEYDPLAKYMCQNCGKGDAEEQMLLCDGCDDSYHTFCLMPPLLEIPQGDWRCPKCVSAECAKPLEAFGFEQAQKEYSLQSFGEMADQFKADYFNMPVHLIPSSLVEKEYWRILANIDEDVTVEYGADLHSMDHGSGFPTQKSKHLSPEDEKYVNAEWNLNNLPVLPNSLLKHIDIDISGMKVPWLYVGMCFSTFCWHVEDHWTPSINYMHWGEPKTWYCIPSSYASKAEEVMKASAQELFQAQPDLLHHIVTTMNPNVLQAQDIPVYRVDQYPGEFIITWPRSYHAGFNQGYNLAEAVNFAPPDWLAIGRLCVDHYSLMRRFCVFCHDELVCKMASDPESLTLQVAAVTYKDMLTMVEREKRLRKALLNGGVKEAEREEFQMLPEEERQCIICKTTCFLSALHFKEEDGDSDGDGIVCLNHFSSMKVAPENLVLKYKYTLDELAVLLQGLKVRAESYDKWCEDVRGALEKTGEDRLEMEELAGMYKQAKEGKYPRSELLEALQLTVEEAGKCETVTKQLCSGRRRTRGEDTKYRLTVDELRLFSSQLKTLPVKVAGQEGVDKILESLDVFRKEAARLLEGTDVKVAEVEKCLELGESLDIDLGEVGRLATRMEQLKWKEKAEQIIGDPKEVELEVMCKMEEVGLVLPPHPEVERELAKIRGLIITLELFEKKAEQVLTTDPKLSLFQVEKLVEEGEAISTTLPSLFTLKDACRKAREWWSRAEALQKPDNYPYVETVEVLVNRGKPIPIMLDPLSQLETQVNAAKAWKERTARVFLKKNSQSSLLDVLAPRCTFGATAGKRRRRKSDGNMTQQMQHPVFQDLSAAQLAEPKEIVEAFKAAEKAELVALREFREKNTKENTPSQVSLDCELCRAQFQPGTVPMPNKPARAKPSSLREIKFLCPDCLRSRRPRLETILSLLVSLQKLTVRLPEGEALQCLTERAMAWQDKARTVLSTPHLSGAMHQLSIGKDDEDSGTTDSEGEGVAMAKKMDGPIVDLDGDLVKVLEDLLLEGDLLEVSLDEVQYIWKVLQATPERRNKQYPELGVLEAELVAAKEKKKLEKVRKRQVKEEVEAKKAVRPRKKRKSGDKKKNVEDGTEDDDCSARDPPCKRPTGKQVHWVQCDGCQLWFHLFCLGMKPTQIKEDEDFLCSHCKEHFSKGKKKDGEKEAIFEKESNSTNESQSEELDTE